MINASTLLSAHDWAESTFGTVRLGDQRRTKRAVRIAEAMAHDPAGSLPAQMQSEAAYRFLETPAVTSERLIAPHLSQTQKAMGKPERVLPTSCATRS